MWILSCSGDLLGGKRLWLPPGSTHLLGRTSNKTEAGERVQYIDHKSVSRKHLVIRVGDVQPSDASKLHQRTGITVTDGSKMGTTLNGDKITKQTKSLDKREYTIKLGSYEQTFRLLWQDVTLTCTNLSKKSKGGDELAAQREQLAGTDIKILADYVSNETSHVVGKKRNVPPALQALAQGKWLVTYAFVDALAAAAHRRDSTAGGDQPMSQLEDDFDANWPSEGNYVVPTGNEPVKRADDYLQPRPERAEVFQDFVFVFLSQNQYDTLMPVVTSGGGKAVVREVQEGESSVEDLVDFVKQLAGEKGNSQFQLSQYSGKGGVVVVRHSDSSEGWLLRFHEAVDTALNQRAIVQNEFLDAILMVDASGLKRLPEESQDAAEGEARVRTPELPQASHSRSGQPASTVVHDDGIGARPEPAQTAHEEQASEDPPATRKRNRRTITQPRFVGFGDDIDASQFQRPASESPPPSFPDPSQAPSVQSMDIGEPSQAAGTQHNTRKRLAPAEEAAEAENAMYESLTTGYAALKRRKTEAAKKGQKDSFAEPLEEAEDGEPARVAKKGKKKEKQVDVKAELAKRRELEAEARRKDEEALREMADLDPNEFKNLAKVEVMELPVRERPARRADENGRSERWDPAWNGRKNFKKFRPQGQSRDGPRLQRVIVTLEEVPRKSQGIGDEYWLTSSNNAADRGKSKSQSQSQAVRAGPSSDDAGDAALRFRRRIQRSREEDEENAQEEEVLPEQIAGRPRDEGLDAQVNGTPSQTFGTESQRRAAGKRPAAQQAGGGPPAKRARQTRANVVNVVEDDDDDDGLKFRRKRR